MDLRKTCDNAPLRMLVFARTIQDAKQLTEQINNISTKYKFGFHAENVQGGDIDATNDVNKRFSCSREKYEEYLESISENRRKPLVDIVVQVKLFGEGYDNDWIAVTLFVAPPTDSMNSIAQGHGRALRAPPLELRQRSKSTRIWYAHLFYPKLEDIWKGSGLKEMVDAYLKGEDEKEVNIVTSIKILGLKLKKEPLATLHKHYRKYEQDYGAAEAIQLMTETADEYHEHYRERRERWKKTPAEGLAEKITSTEISKYLQVPRTQVPSSNSANRDTRLDTGPTPSFKIIDFGCGKDLLFERKLYDQVIDLQGNLHVDVLAVDLKEYSDSELRGGANFGPGQVTFECTPTGCNFIHLRKEQSYLAWYGKTKRLAKCAVFCLSLMLEQSFPAALSEAVKLVTAKGSIHIVMDITKIGLSSVKKSKDVKRQVLDAWRDNFTKKCNGLLKVQASEEDGFCYIKIINATDKEKKKELADVLDSDSLTIENLKVPAEEVARIESRKRTHDASFDQ